MKLAVRAARRIGQASDVPDEFPANPLALARLLGAKRVFASVTGAIA